MSTDTILRPEEIGRIALSVGCDPEHDDGALVVRLARAIEQAVLQSAQVQQWQPIETAPKDGTWVAAWRNIEGPLIGSPLEFVCWFDFDDEPGWAWPCEPYNPWTLEGQEQALRSIESGDWYSCDDFTHWMPLPAPPQQ